MLWCRAPGALAPRSEWDAYLAYLEKLPPTLEVMQEIKRARSWAGVVHLTRAEMLPHLKINGPRR